MRWIFLLIILLATSTAQAAIFKVKIDGIIDPITSEFITGAVETAEEQEAEFLLIELSTPGGLGVSMQEIIQDGDLVYTLLAPRNYRLLYYLDVPVLRIESLEDMVAEVGEGERVHVLVMEEGKDTLEDLQPGRWSMVVSFPNKVGTGFL
ncbi:MAG: hypothetical protein IIB03_06780, partial [Acidobacteria bacterium]|nr:hypothetical protein [Acidobacteriota bacterium]